MISYIIYYMANGTYFKSNALKFMIMNALYRNRAFNAATSMTCAEISYVTGVPHIKIANSLLKYHNKRCGYFRRSKPMGGEDHKDRKAYRYSLNNKGLYYFLRYCSKIKGGFGLNLRGSKVTLMPRFEEIRMQRAKEWHDAHVVLAQKGVFVDPRKKTLNEKTNIKRFEFRDYVGITKRGSLVLGVTEDNKLQAAFGLI